MKKLFLISLFIVMVSVLIIGCTGIGPKTIPRDRFDYSAAISKSWQNQMLLNMVKLRYGETPVFVDVTSVISQYAVESQVSLGAIFNNPLANSGDTQSIGGTGKYTDRPTITYAPMVGKKFAKTMMTPIPPPAIFFLIQSGWPVDFILRSCVKSVNTFQNRSGTRMLRHEADLNFYRLVSLLRDIQKSGAVSVRIEVDKNKREFTVFTFRRENIDPEIESKISSLKRLLNLEPGRREFRVVYSSAPRDKNEIAVLTRALLEIIIELSSYIDIPQAHISEGRSFPTLMGHMDLNAEFGPLIEIHSQTDPPKAQDSFVSVEHRGYYFWIDDRDMRSKRMFSFIMLLFTLVEPKEALAPMVTIPTN
ncbi:MAG: hypothetical protein ACWGNI_07515 [Desulfobacterales bacterium]